MAHSIDQAHRGCKEKCQPLVVLLLLSLLAFLIYSNTFSVPFVLDDIPRIAQDPKIKHIWTLMGTSLGFSNSRTVGYLTFALNYHFGGLNVFGYHLVNLLIHIANGFLVYSLVLLLFRASRSKEDRASWIAFTAALLFIAHPIQTQAVTYIVQRFASLATLFYLLGVVCYLKWRMASLTSCSESCAVESGASPEETKRRHIWYGIALLATVLAMKTKEMAFTLPFTILLAEAFFFWPLPLRRWLCMIPFLVTLFIIPLSSFDGGLGSAEAVATSKIPLSDYLMTQFRVIVTYLRLLLFPVQQNLDYDYPVYHSFLDPPVFASFLLLISLLASAVYLFRRTRRTKNDLQPSSPISSRLIAFGIFWFFLTLSSESSIIPIDDVIFEHRLYLPSVGLFLVMSIVIMVAEKRFRTSKARSFRPSAWVIVFIGAIVVLLSVATYKRNAVWHDQVGLWQDVVAKSPKKARARNNLAVAYQNKGMLEASIRESQTALDLNPEYAEAHGNLGDSYAEQGRSEAAINQYQMVIKLQPDNVKAYNNLGIVYKNLGRLDDAIMAYQMALNLQPDYAAAHNNLGNAYVAQGRSDAAIHEYHLALKFDPGICDAHYNLGNAFALQEHWEAAIHEYQIALNLQPDDPDVHYNLGLAYMIKGNREAARKELEKTLKTKPDYNEAHRALDELYK